MKDDGGRLNWAGAGGCLLCRVVVDFAGISSIRNVVMKEEEKTENFCERPTKTISHITSPFALVGPEGWIFGKHEIRVVIYPGTVNTSASSMRGGIPQPNADRNICVPTCAGEYPSHVPAPVVDDDDDESKETRKNFAALYLFNYFPIISPLDSMSCMPSAAVCFVANKARLAR